MREPRTDKFTDRRAELGRAALHTLGALGYARTSLREIAQNSAFSHGVLHYYFKDKLDLILCSVRQYKAICVTRYDRALGESKTYDELMKKFIAELGNTLRREAGMHRLWYDVRAQALFNEAFRADVAAIDRSLEDMIRRVLTRFAEFADTEVSAPASVAYALFDGLFQQCLLRHLSGDKRAVRFLQVHVRWLVSRALRTPPRCR